MELKLHPLAWVLIMELDRMTQIVFGYEDKELMFIRQQMVYKSEFAFCHARWSYIQQRRRTSPTPWMITKKVLGRPHWWGLRRFPTATKWKVCENWQNGAY